MQVPYQLTCHRAPPRTTAKRNVPRIAVTLMFSWPCAYSRKLVHMPKTPKFEVRRDGFRGWGAHL
jgi:hypothetical protein